MDGAVAASMREKGLQYRIIWGVSILHLQEMAKEIGGDADLARELWKEDCRECRILATMIMPSKAMTPEEADSWTSTLTTKETAEWLAFNLIRHLPFARQWAEKRSSSDNTLQRLCAEYVLARVNR